MASQDVAVSMVTEDPEDTLLYQSNQATVQASQ